MKRIFLCALLAIAGVFSAHAQTITVKDLTTLEAISGASVFISANNIELRDFIGNTNNEGIIDHLRSIEGVEAAVFFEELPENKVRVSARSKIPAIDVCKVCKQFQGGGHPMASGARIPGSLQQVKHDFLKALDHEIRNRN
jgi:nanoRNase/pAp phosphatase (c-di-AMP/oligoRNAs hydrolase)